MNRSYYFESCYYQFYSLLVYSKVVYKDARMSNKPVNVLKGGEEAAKDIYAVVDGLFEKGVF